MFLVGIIFYGVTFDYYIIIILGLISLIGTIVEGITPRGLDNLFVPFIVVFLYWLLLIL
jgi:dolichol kinase